MNGGLQVVNPSVGIFNLIQEYMASDRCGNLDFADQSLLSDLFRGCWVPLPYTYNALKTLRWEGVHNEIWRDDKVKNVHYIFSPKPWDEEEGKEGADPTHAWWHKSNNARLAEEKAKGIKEDGF
jgi:lipopolysaccharide biosynthesis glycosyltransferase